MTAGINALPQSLIAHGTAMHNTIRTVGASIFTALLVSVMSLGKSQQIANSDEIFQGIKLAFLVALIFAFVGLLLSSSYQKRKKLRWKV